MTTSKILLFKTTRLTLVKITAMDSCVIGMQIVINRSMTIPSRKAGNISQNNHSNALSLLYESFVT